VSAPSGAPGATARDDVAVRRATDDDGPAVLELLADSLGWERDATFAAYFDWKHHQNPFGSSPAWVAVSDDRIVGFRTFLCWEFEHPDGRARRAVRAVDTATAPAFQGRGVFRLLTTTAIDALTHEGVDFVFNTPNDQSRPGYLRMGWTQVGRLPLEARIASVAGLWRMRTARVAAERWPVATDAGEDASSVLASDRVGALLDRLGSPRGLRTATTAAYLRWRYGLPQLGYRAIALDGDVASGVAVFRLRRRGEAVEAGVSELLAPDTASARRLLGAVRRDARADYVIRLGRPGFAVPSGGFVPLPRFGPILTYRPLADRAAPPALAELDFRLGDVELL
jgi:GNAT superfamily N-acetyltransferase